MKSLKPVVIIIGAQRSGTTFLSKVLEASFGAKILKPKTRKGEPRHLFEENGSETLDELNVSIANLLVDKSTSYLRREVTVKRILEMSSKVKILCVLRNPIYRAISAFNFSKNNGVENQDFEQVLKFFENGTSRTLESTGFSENPLTYFEGSSYSKILKPWVTSFSSDQIRFFTSEEIWKNPQEFVLRLGEYLDLPVNRENSTLRSKINSSEGIGVLENVERALANDFFVRWLEHEIEWCEQNVFDRDLIEWREFQSDIVGRLRLSRMGSSKSYWGFKSEG